MKFYILDVGIYSASDWQREKLAREAGSPEIAASDYIAGCDEACVDGQRFEVVVAEEEDGSDARLYTGTCIITYEFRVTRSREYEVEADDEPMERSCRHGTRPIDDPCEVCDAE